MSKFTDDLWRDLVQEHGPTLAHADRPEPGRARLLRVRAFSRAARSRWRASVRRSCSPWAGRRRPPAFAITKKGDGSVLVNLNYVQDQNLPQVNHKLNAMGIHEQITIYMATGAAPVSGPVTCTPAPGASVGAAGEGSRGHRRHGGHRPGPVRRQHRPRAPSTWTTASSRVTPARATPATRAPVDPVTAADARPARASAMARLAVRPPGDGGGRTAAWWPWLLVAAAVGWNLVSLRALTLGVAYLERQLAARADGAVRDGAAARRAPAADELVPVPRRGVAAVPSLPEPAGDADRGWRGWRSALTWRFAGRCTCCCRCGRSASTCRPARSGRAGRRRPPRPRWPRFW